MLMLRVLTAPMKYCTFIWHWAQPSVASFKFDLKSLSVLRELESDSIPDFLRLKKPSKSIYWNWVLYIKSLLPSAVTYLGEVGLPNGKGSRQALTLQLYQRKRQRHVGWGNQLLFRYLRHCFYPYSSIRHICYPSNCALLQMFLHCFPDEEFLLV